MSAPPYMRLYWGDYHRGTRLLRSAAEHGAYLLLIGALWDSGGKLPNDDDTLSRLALCSPDEWASIRPTLMPFFQVRRGMLTHKRVAEELAKYESTIGKRKEAGKLGGSASNGKLKGISQANAKHLPTYSEPEPEPERTTADDSARGRFSNLDREAVQSLEKQLREAAGASINSASPMLQVVAPILGLLRPGDGPACDLELDVLPAIRAAATRTRSPKDRWDYFVPMIREARDRRLQGAPAVGDVTQLRSTGPPANSFMDRFEADRAEARRRVLNG